MTTIKNITKKIAMLFMLAVMLLPAFSKVNVNAATANVTCKNAQGTVLCSYALTANSTSAAGTNKTNIQEALNKAKTTSGNITVTIPAGTYYINGTLNVFSDTRIEAAGATIIGYMSSMTGSLIAGRHLNGTNVCSGDSSCGHGGYTQCINITINGGTWDRGVTSANIQNKINSDSANGITINNDYKQNNLRNNVIMIRHAQNINIQNCVIQGATWHMLNLSANKNSTVSNVKFKNQVEIPGFSDARKKRIEVIHLDFAVPAGEPNAHKLDGTPCQNVTVQNCIFDSVYSGIGAHEASKSELLSKANGPMSGINIKNNVFINVKADCVNAVYMTNSTIQDNYNYGYATFVCTNPSGDDYANVNSVTQSNNTNAGTLNAFSDVPASSVSKCIYWGVSKGYIVGYSDGTFRPDNPLTRKQLCVILWRRAGKPSATITSAFSDISSCSANEKTAISWAYNNGYIGAYETGYFRPDYNITRGQTCTVLYRIAGKPATTINNSIFADMSSCTSDGIKKSVTWAYNAGLVAGSNGYFYPNNSIVRKDIITILWRWDN